MIVPLKTITNDNLRIPTELSPEGVKAWKAITALLLCEEAIYTGGCTAFYSPTAWNRRGEKYGSDSVLIVCHDGGELGRYFSYDDYDYDAIARMDFALENVGLWAEACTRWYTAIYRQDS